MEALPVPESLAALQATVKRLLAFLEGRQDAVLHLPNPSPGGWTLGQVYAHVFGAATGFFLNKAEQARSTTENAEKEKNDYGVKLYKYNSFPPVKAKVPEAYDQGAPAQPASIAEVNNEAERLLAEAEALASKFAAEDRGGKKGHVVFGYLNGPEWFQMAELHTRHHIKQLESLLDIRTGEPKP